MLFSHDFSFDPTYGYDDAALAAVEAPKNIEPAAFENFWRETHRRARQVPPRAQRRLIRSGRRGNVFEVEFDAWEPQGDRVRRIGGWMITPPGPAAKALVVGHGYGGRSGPDTTPLLPDAAVIYPCARGFNRSEFPDIPNVADRHVLHGIESPDTYVHRGCVIDLWAALWALMELEPALEVAGFAGASFGGGIGALAVPWEPLFARAFYDFPSFGNHPLRLTMPCVGSGEAIRRSGGACHLPVLKYFDASTAAMFTTIPVMVAAARFDPAVPPPGQFAIYNALAGEKKLFVREAAHFDWPGGAAEDARVNRAAADWLGAAPADRLSG